MRPARFVLGVIALALGVVTGTQPANAQGGGCAVPHACYYSPTCQGWCRAFLCTNPVCNSSGSDFCYLCDVT